MLEPAGALSLQRQQAWLLATAVVLPRLLLWLSAMGARYDIESYLLVERAMALGEPLYANAALEGRYPYLPAWAWVLKLLGGLGRAYGFAPWMLFKLPALLADAAISALLWRLGGRAGFAIALAYALSPVAWLVGAGHGQFDAVVLLGLLLALAALERGGDRAPWVGGASFGAALAFKLWPLFLLPAFVRPLTRKQALAFGAAACAVPLALTLPYLAREGAAALGARLFYGGSSNLSLPEALRLLGAQFFPPDLALAPFALWRSLAWAGLLACWTAVWFQAPRPAREQALNLSLALLVFAPALSAQYLLWPLPWLALASRRWAWAYSVGVGLLLLIYYRAYFPGALRASWEPLAFGAQAGGAWRSAWAALNLLLWSGLLLLWARASKPRAS